MRESSGAGAEKPHIGPFRLTADILRSDGVPGLFRGLRPTFVREMPGYFCFFFAYEFCRELLTQEGESQRSDRNCTCIRRDFGSFSRTSKKKCDDNVW